MKTDLRRRLQFGFSPRVAPVCCAVRLGLHAIRTRRWCGSQPLDRYNSKTVASFGIDAECLQWRRFARLGPVPLEESFAITRPLGGVHLRPGQPPWLASLVHEHDSTVDRATPHVAAFRLQSIASANAPAVLPDRLPCQLSQCRDYDRAL